jgi:hypothetical protein
MNRKISIKKSVYIGILAVILLFVFYMPAFPCRKQQGNSKAESLHKDITIINLVNNLDLRREQMEFIIRGAKQAEQIHRESLNKIDVLSRDATAIYEAIKQEVQSGKTVVEKDVMERFRQTKAQIEEIKKDAYAQIEEIASGVEAKLEPFQLEALDAYKPCIIPIISNGRIGQFDGDLGISRLLQRVRQIPTRRYNEKREYIASHLLEKVKTRFPLGVEFNEPQIKSEILNVFETVRSMDDVDFQVSKEVIAQQIRERILPEKKEMSRIAKIEKFLLSENIIPILQERVNNL